MPGHTHKSLNFFPFSFTKPRQFLTRALILSGPRSLHFTSFEMNLQDWLDFIDIENLLYAIIGSIGYIFWDIKGYPHPHHLETPPGEYDIRYSKVAHQTVTDLGQGLVVVGQALLFIPLPRVLSLWFPLFRSYRVLTALWCYFFSLSLAGITYGFFKGYVGRPRPDALERAHGDLDHCTAKDANSEFSSFPSGHAASTMNCAVFLALFLVSSTTRPTHLMTVVGFGIWMYTVFIGCSRIVDHRHHPSDVVAGWIVGAALSVIAWAASKDQIFTAADVGSASSTFSGGFLEFLNPSIATVGRVA
jgi:membrane-associated phospholipid phosphatase